MQRSHLFGASPVRVRFALRQLEPEVKEQPVFVPLERGFPVLELAVAGAERARFPVIEEIHAPDEFAALMPLRARRPLRRPNRGFASACAPL